MPIEFNPQTGNYQNNGRAVTESRMNQLVDSIADGTDEIIQGRLARYYRDGEFRGTPEEINAMMRAAVKDSVTAQYILGRGGRNAMTQSDWGRVGFELRQQYALIASFSQKVADGTYSQAKAAAVARLYALAGRTTYGRAQTVRYGVGVTALPVPGDGTTACKVGCKCRRVFEQVDERTIHVYWNLGRAEHCADCIRRSQEWTPLVIVDGEVQDPSKVRASDLSMLAHLTMSGKKIYNAKDTIA